MKIGIIGLGIMGRGIANNFLKNKYPLFVWNRTRKVADEFEKIAEALADRPGGMITGIAKKAYFENPPPLTFSIEWITKDLTYAKKLAKGLDVGLLDKVLSLYKKGMKKNMAKEDWAAINKII